MSVFNTEELKVEINTILNDAGEPMDNNPSTPQKQIISSKNLKPSSRKKIKEEFISSSSLIPRPHTIQDFVEKEQLTKVTDTDTTLLNGDLDPDEEFWIFDIPKTINPVDLKGQVIQLQDDKSNLKIDNVKYCATNRNSTSSLTCVFKTHHSFKTVNIKPTGTLCIRKKLAKVSKKNVEYQKATSVPYPKNIKQRHPFFGVQNDLNVKSER